MNENDKACSRNGCCCATDKTENKKQKIQVSKQRSIKCKFNSMHDKFKCCTYWLNTAMAKLLNG